VSFPPQSMTVPKQVFILSEGSNVNVSAGATVYLPDSSGIPISQYRFKTISLKGDYALNVRVEVSDDGSTWDTYYPTATDWEALTANKLKTMSFEDDYLYVRIAVNNPDSFDHTISYYRIKGRG